MQKSTHPRLRPSALRYALRTESELAGKHELVEVSGGHEELGNQLPGQLRRELLAQQLEVAHHRGVHEDGIGRDRADVAQQVARHRAHVALLSPHHVGVQVPDEVVLEVTDDGEPALTRDAQAIVTVNKEAEPVEETAWQ